MTEPLVSEALAAFATDVGPERDATLREMEAYADRTDFPVVGPAVGGWLAVLARLVDARRVFEFGSGFGYSAYWFARALPEDGTVVLTETDADRLDRARAFFEEGGLADRARFERGDAVDLAASEDGRLDVVLLDHEKDRYVEGFEAVRANVPDGGLVLADNAVTASHMTFEDLRTLVAGGSVPDAAAPDRGMADYLARVGADDAFETVLLPLGEGVAVSARTG